MKKYLAHFAATAAFCLLMACGANSHSDHEHADHDNSDHQHEHQTKNHSPDIEVSLNEGEVWQANAETTHGIHKMTAMLNDFSETESLEAYAHLRDGLHAEFNEILQKCTMDGEAHEQLHNYLVPMKNIIEEVGSDNLEKCQEKFDQLQGHLGAYTTYFK